MGKRTRNARRRGRRSIEELQRATQDLEKAKAIGVFVTKLEVAQLLGVSLRSVENFLANGLPHYRTGSIVRFDLTQVREWWHAKFHTVKAA